MRTWDDNESSHHELKILPSKIRTSDWLSLNGKDFCVWLVPQSLRQARPASLERFEFLLYCHQPYVLDQLFSVNATNEEL
jgi:hypothetical protein